MPHEPVTVNKNDGSNWRGFVLFLVWDERWWLLVEKARTEYLCGFQWTLASAGSDSIPVVQPILIIQTKVT